MVSEVALEIRPLGWDIWKDSLAGQMAGTVSGMERIPDLQKHHSYLVVSCVDFDVVQVGREVVICGTCMVRSQGMEFEWVPFC